MYLVLKIHCNVSQASFILVSMECIQGPGKNHKQPLGGYSHGQAKPSNLVSQQGVHLGVRFFQILTQIVEMY